MGGEGSVGARGEDIGRNVIGTWTSGVHGTSHAQASGIVYAKTVYQPGIDSPDVLGVAFGIDASRIWGATHTGAEFAPIHIWQPIAAYTGTHA